MLGARGDLLPALLANKEPLARRLFSLQEVKKSQVRVCQAEDTQEWEPRRPKANPGGSLGVQDGVSLEEGTDTGTPIPAESQAGAPEPPFTPELPASGI